MRKGAGQVWPLGEDQAPVTWTAVWIAPQGFEGRPNACFRARRRIELIHEQPQSLLLHICAESTYRLYVNGQEVGRGPVRGTCTVNFFDSYEVAALLHPGENWVAAEVHCHNRATSLAHPVQPALLIQGWYGRIATDSSWQVQAGDEWRADVPLYTYQVGYMEWRDLRGEPRGWQTGRDRAAWHAPVCVTADPWIGGKKLFVRDIPPLTERDVLPMEVRAIGITTPLDSTTDLEVAQRMSREALGPLAQPVNCVSLSRAADHPVVIASPPGGGGMALLAFFNEEINGRLEVDIDAPAGTILDVGYEEQDINGRLMLTAFGYRFADRYILREGRQLAGTHFAQRGYRLAQIVLRNFNRPIRLQAIRGVQRRYPYSNRGSFTCSDPLLNQIWEAAVETLAVCGTDAIVDCPWRENTLWLNDLMVSNLTSLQAFGDPRMGARCFRLAASQPRSDGMLPGAVPAGQMPGIDDLEASTDSLVLLAANLFLADMLEEHLHYTGDDELVREMLPALLRIHQTFATWEDTNGLVQPHPAYWNFIDWSYPHPPEDGKENAAVLNWFRIASLASTARLLEYFGEGRQAAQMRHKAAGSAAAADRRFWNDQRACYVECAEAPEGLATQVCHAVALLSGFAPPGRMPQIAAALNREDLLAPELYMHHLVLRALVRFGHADVAIERIRKYWGPIVRSGSPTIGECGVHQPHAKSSFMGAASLCHGFSTTPVDFLQTVVLGVRPEAAGFGLCRIRPYYFDLSHAQGSVPTPHGALAVSWRREKANVVLELEVPPSIKVDLGDGRMLHAGKHQVELPAGHTTVRDA